MPFLEKSDIHVSIFMQVSESLIFHESDILFQYEPITICMVEILDPSIESTLLQQLDRNTSTSSPMHCTPTP